MNFIFQENVKLADKTHLQKYDNVAFCSFISLNCFRLGDY